MEEYWGNKIIIIIIKYKALEKGREILEVLESYDLMFL
jgi:hypothetical protein